MNRSENNKQALKEKEISKHFKLLRKIFWDSGKWRHQEFEEFLKEFFGELKNIANEK